MAGEWLLDGLIDNGLGQVPPGVVGLGQAGFELVAESHEGIDFLDDAILFGEGRKGNSPVL